jgi:hypothetical protein
LDVRRFRGADGDLAAADDMIERRIMVRLLGVIFAVVLHVCVVIRASPMRMLLAASWRYCGASFMVAASDAESPPRLAFREAVDL